MKRVTIYVDEADWEDIKKLAWKLSALEGKIVSVGNYLVSLHKESIRKTVGFVDENGSISEEVYNNIWVLVGIFFIICIVQ